MAGSVSRLPLDSCCLTRYTVAASRIFVVERLEGGYNFAAVEKHLEVRASRESSRTVVTGDGGQRPYGVFNTLLGQAKKGGQYQQV